MTDWTRVTPETLAELRRLYEAAFTVGAPENEWEEWTSKAAEAFPALLDAANDADALRAELAHMTEARAEVERLAVVVRRVRELHRESRSSLSALYPNPICECGKDYPCPTIRALDAGGVS